VGASRPVATQTVLYLTAVRLLKILGMKKTEAAHYTSVSRRPVCHRSLPGEWDVMWVSCREAWVYAASLLC